MIYDCCVRQKKCRSILKHVLKRYDNRKSCRKPVVMLVACDKIVSCKSALRTFLSSVETGLSHLTFMVSPTIDAFKYGEMYLDRHANTFYPCAQTDSTCEDRVCDKRQT